MDLIPRYDRENTLFYLDPPYVPDTRVGGEYECEMSTSDHERMVELLLKSKGMFVLSGYRSPIYEPLENAGWKLHQFDVNINSSRKGAKRTECLWVSPSCEANKINIAATTNQKDEDSLTNRQKAAYRVHTHRRDATTTLIRDSIKSLKRMKKRVTKAEVSRMTGISREHISRHYSDLF